MTYDQRIAASECINLIALLVEAGTPESKNLARIVCLRLTVIVDHDYEGALTEAHIKIYAQIARAALSKTGV